MARILVTGGTAGIGQAVVAQLIAEGHSVIASTNFAKARFGILRSTASLITRVLA